LKAFAARLKQHLVTLHLAGRDPRTPWYAKAFVACVLAYALSPIDLIPDVIPILGYLDDLVLVPLGIYFAIRLIPPEVLAECRTRAAEMNGTLPHSRKAAAVIVLIWLLMVLLAGYFLFGVFSF
jgi:uncharacterized membrane protein YkvA (DUF1232 family)